jgi:hypothetical protein
MVLSADDFGARYPEVRALMVRRVEDAGGPVTLLQG